MRIGSPEHRELFCGTFFANHRKYEPAELPWPDLDGEPLALLRSLPFWTFAVQAEEDAGPMIYACAERETDPLCRQALELQGFEESRHARILKHMVGLYGLPLDEIRTEMPEDVVEGFIDFGFEECLDSFGAFGLFALARHSRLVPDPLFGIFDQVMQEEANHIVFFLNWYADRQSRLGLGPRLWRTPKALYHYGKAAWKLVDLMRDDDTQEGEDFIATGATAFVEELTPRLVMETCLAENERRLAGFDRRLLVPRLFPALARLGAAALRWVPPRRNPAAGAGPEPHGAPGGESRAA